MMTTSTIKLAAVLTVVVAAISQLGVNGQGGRSIDVNTLGQRWGQWGQWSDACRRTFPKCGNVEERRQRLCYAYQVTGSGAG